MAAYPAARPTIPDVSQSPPNANKLGSASGTWHSNLHNLLADNLLAALDKIGYSASSPADIPILGSMLACDADGKSKWTSAITQGKVLVGTNGAPVVTNPSFVNLLVNGGFERWQRGSLPFTTNNAYTADRWQISNLSGGDSMSVSIDQTHQDASSASCLAFVYTKSAGANCQIIQKLEDAAELAGQTISVSLRAKIASGTGNYRISLFDGITQTFSAVCPNDGAYHTLTATALISVAATAVYVIMQADSASVSGYMDNCMLVVGSTPVNYIPLTHAEEWARCQRYYDTLMGGASGEYAGAAQALSGSAADMLWRYTLKAVTPTITVSNPSSFGALTPSGGALNTFTGASGFNISTKSALVQFTGGSGLTAGNATMIQISNTNAQIVAEANP